MKEDKHSYCKASCYVELGESLDSLGADDLSDEIFPVEFDVDIQSNVTYYPLSTNLAAKLRGMAKRSGVAPKLLLESWVREKLHEESQYR